MILLDLTGTMYANIAVNMGKGTKIEEDLVRHMVLNSIRALKLQFKNYGEMVLCCDNKHYWRKDVFPYYKAKRKAGRDASGIDWKAVFDSMHKIKQELKENFPYPLIDVHGAEADDVIGVMATTKSRSEPPIMILSADRDMLQLQAYNPGYIKQWDPIRKKAVTHPNPVTYMYEHIMKGDAGDGIPNVLSPDDVFISGGRQKPMRAERLSGLTFRAAVSSFSANHLMHDEPEEIRRNVARNEQLIKLSYTPKSICDAILAEYEAQQGKGKSKLFGYFIQHRLKHLMDAISDF